MNQNSTSANEEQTRSENHIKWDMIFKKPEQWLCFTPKEGLHTYACLACQTLFFERSSFVDHVNRRALVIMYKCLRCSHNLQLRFYNSCSFLLHVYKHFQGSECKIDLNHVTVETLPIGFAGLLPHKNIPLLYAANDDCMLKDKMITPIFHVPQYECKGSNIVSFYGTTLLFGFNPNQYLELKQVSLNIPHCKFIRKRDGQTKSEIVQTKCNIWNTCTECKNKVTNMITHFNGTDGVDDSKHRCIICNLILTSACSLSAHKRIHFERAPYVCPECGINFVSFKQLLLHAYKMCLHVPKQVHYKCNVKNCTKTYLTLVAYNAHLKTHLVHHYECKICLVRINNNLGAKSHADMHPDVPSTKCMKVLLYCTICTQYVEKESEHIDTHVTGKHSLVYVYRCKFCRNCLRSKQSYMSHDKTCPKKFNPKWIGKQVNLLLSHECTYCGTNYKLMYSNNVLGACPDCTDDSERMCILCGKIFTTPKLRLHLFNDECRYVNPFVKLEQLPHKRLRKYMTTVEDDEEQQQSTESEEFVNNAASQMSPEVTFSSNDSVADDNHISESVLIKGTYSCSLCEFSNDSRQTFHEHIKSHRNVSTAYQCMECGECFVVKPSLGKHLLHHHQIDDIDAYVKENNCYDVKAINELTDNIKLGATKTQLRANQCSICYKKFNHNLELKKHFRVHGMAFLYYNSK